MKKLFALTALFTLCAMPAMAAELVDDTALAAIAEKRVKAIDTNGDGGIDKNEYLANAAKKFEASDANKDGRIDANEMLAIKRKEASDLSKQ